MMNFQIQEKFQTEASDFLEETDTRRLWRQRRSAMEWRYQKSIRYALWRFMKYQCADNLERLFEKGLKAFGLYKRGMLTAGNLVVNRQEIHFSNLPAAFDSYRILHLTDLHLDTLEDTGRLVAQKIKGLKVDLCVITGDYRNKMFGKYEHIIDPVRIILESVKAKDGIIGTLGNHDSHLLAYNLEKMGMTVLTNETVTLSRGDEDISFTGLDDPHNYYTPQAKEAMEDTGSGFKIALVHSPEMYDIAERNGYQLYLCGHTHGGQICLPGGIPVITHLRKGKRYVRGLWQVGNMKGFTNQGCGVVGIPVRFYTQSEVALITLKRRRVDHLNRGES